MNAKRLTQWLVPILLMGLMIPEVQADPVSSFSATAPTLYDDGTVIPVSDVLSYRLYCGDTAAGPYLFSFDTPTLAPGTQIDVGACVQGTPGTYYFVATAISGTFNTESVFSNEDLRTYTQADLPKTPNEPTLFTVQ